MWARMPDSKKLMLSALGHRRVRRGNLEDAQTMRLVLLDAAYHLFREGGLEAVTIRGVALRAQVAVMTPYRYFKNKADLLAGLWESVVGELIAQQKLAVEQCSTPRDRLKANIEAYLSFWETHPEHYQLVYMPKLNRAGEIRTAVVGTPVQREIWAFSNRLTLDFAKSIGGDPGKVETASQLRHFLVLGFLHISLVNQRPTEQTRQLRPVVVEQAIETCARYLLGGTPATSPGRKSRRP